MGREPETTAPEHHIYHGSVTGLSGEDWVDVDAYSGGYAPLITFTLGFGCGEARFSLDPSEAMELGRHMTQAAELFQAKVENHD